MQVAQKFGIDIDKITLQEVKSSVVLAKPIQNNPDIDSEALNKKLLKTSNVDLSRALTQLIIIQRGFQANGKTITTSDQLLQTLIGLKNYGNSP